MLEKSGFGEVVFGICARSCHSLCFLIQFEIAHGSDDVAIYRVNLGVGFEELLAWALFGWAKREDKIPFLEVEE